MSMRIYDKPYFDGVMTFAETIGLTSQLQEKLDYLDSYAEHGDRGNTVCHLFPDFAPHSFQFRIEIRGEDGEYKPWLFGGCLYHGPHDGGSDGSFPTLAVSLSPCHGWQIHT
jgi:hypothetical protein